MAFNPTKVTVAVNVQLRQCMCQFQIRLSVMQRHIERKHNARKAQELETGMAHTRRQEPARQNTASGVFYSADPFLACGCVL